MFRGSKAAWPVSYELVQWWVETSVYESGCLPGAFCPPWRRCRTRRYRSRTTLSAELPRPTSAARTCARTRDTLADPGFIFGDEDQGIIEEIDDGFAKVKVSDRVSMPFNLGCGCWFNCKRGQTYWKAVAAFEISGDGDGLIVGWETLLGRCPDSEWAKKASLRQRTRYRLFGAKLMFNHGLCTIVFNGGLG